MHYLVIGVVALLASGLTFFSGFGLGTLLLPAFAAFFPVTLAIAMTAVVHLSNGLFKVVLVGRHVHLPTLWRFGLPAAVAAFGGAWLLGQLANLEPWVAYEFVGRQFSVTPVKFSVGLLLLAFTAWEIAPATRDRQFGPNWMTLGGVLSGFFGGLSGNQGALRAAFLIKAGLSKEAFVGTGAVISGVIDVVRIGTYVPMLREVRGEIPVGLLFAGMFAAFVGAFAGNRLLGKVTLRGIQQMVVMLVSLTALGLMSGLL